jgi:hypothetical protein
MTATKRTKLKNYDTGPTQTLAEQGEAEAPMPLHRKERPGLSGEGARTALQHLIERESRLAEHKLPLTLERNPA